MTIYIHAMVGDIFDYILDQVVKLIVFSANVLPTDGETEPFHPNKSYIVRYRRIIH